MARAISSLPSEAQPQREGRRERRERGERRGKRGVAHIDVPVLVDEKVEALDIAVENAGIPRVQRVHRLRDLQRRLEELFPVQVNLWPLDHVVQAAHGTELKDLRGGKE